MQTSFHITPQQIKSFNDNGYLLIERFINETEVEAYKVICEKFLDGTIITGKNRTDLGAGLGYNTKSENITQIMWPCDFAPELLEMPYQVRALAIAKELMGEDMEMDFDMIINKAPNTNTPTPWHQDAAYWIDLPDKRAVSFWMALDEAVKDNGCMWYGPGSHLKELRPHYFAGQKGGALQCDATEDEGVFIELRPGSCVLHHGETLHYSRGNSTNTNRSAFIVNYRPKAMIAFERAQGFDHGRSGNAAERKIGGQEIK